MPQKKKKKSVRALKKESYALIFLSYILIYMHGSPDVINLLHDRLQMIARDGFIMGTKGSLRIPSTECWNGSVGGAMKIYHDICGRPTETIVPLLNNNPNTTLFDLKIRSFIDAVKNGGAAPVPTSQILYNQAILSGIATSWEKGEEIKIEIPEI